MDAKYKVVVTNPNRDSLNEDLAQIASRIKAKYKDMRIKRIKIISEFDKQKIIESEVVEL